MIDKIPIRLVKFRIIIILSLICISGYSQNTYLPHFGTKDGLPSNNCFYTIQDSKGYLWIATDAGVSRFDGNVFENFSVDDGLPDNQILQLKEDKKGRIWFLALNGQLSYFHDGKIYNETNNSLLKLLRFNAVIVSFFEDSKGRIWLGTNKNVLVMWDGSKIMKYISASEDRKFINTFIHEDKQGQIWAFSNRCVRIFGVNGFHIFPHSSLPISYKTALNLPNNTMAYIDQRGLNIKDGNQEYFSLKVNPLLLNSDLGYFHIDENNELWLSNSTGIHHIQKNGKVNNYLVGVTSSQVVRDANNNMWFTTNNGIYMLPKQSERLYIVDSKAGLSNNVVKSVVKDARGRLWLGYNESVIDVLRIDKMLVSNISLPNKSKYNTIKELNFDYENQSVYFASDYGLGRITNIYSNNKQIENLKEANNSMFVIKSFSISNDSKLSLALSSGVVIIPDRHSNFSFSSLFFKEGRDFFNDRAYCVFYDSEQNLWFSNINGLSKLSNGKLYRFYEQSSLLRRRISDIAELNDGTIVLATDGFGLVYLNNNKIIKVVTQKDGLADNICKKIFVEDNSVWVATNNGINKVKLKGKTAVVETFEYTNAMLKDDVNGLYVDSDYAYFATNNGLVYFPILKTENEKEAPQVFISSVINNKVKLSLSKRVHTLDPSYNNISFHYSAIDFQNQNILYRYRLKGDGNWTETKNRRLEFSSLEPGNYIFEISAKSNNTDWSKPAKVNFVVEEHFWQTTWFMVLIFSIAGIMFYKVAVLVTKRQKNKEKEQLLLKNKILMLEQRALQAMMNPHFVFNVMNSIQHYINTKDTTSANKILTGFARLIRKNLEICTKSFISLEEELEYLELYLSLEKKRFGEKFNYTIQIDSQIDREETVLPSMILQPYIENAIWHGIMPKDEGGKIDIHIDLGNRDDLVIQIIDDGIGIDNSLRNKKGQHFSKGMDLTKERINLLNQVELNPIQMTVTQNGNSGTFVSISIPLKS